MVDQIRKPGVNITQVFEGTPPTPVTANLVPCIVGPAFEVVELLDDSGAGSAESRVQSSTGPLKYKQVPVTIPVSEYPTPRADANEMSVMTDEVRVALQRTGALDILDRSPGSAFLAEANIATRPGIWISSTYLSEQANAGRGVILLVDTAVTNNAASVFVQGVAGSTAADYLDNIVSSVNGVGYVAHELNGVAGFILHSNRFGASASISMVSTSGGSVSSFFNDIDAGAALQVAGEDLTKVRVEGSGLYAEDNVVAGILTSPFIAHSRGSFSLTTTATTHVLTDNTSLGDIKAVQVHINGEIVEVRTDAVDFANDFALQAATPTSNGDSITASGPFGQSIGSHQIIGVASDRVRVGIVDTERSVYDAEGNPVQQRYVDAQLNSMSSAVPFAPKNAFFRAHSLKSFAPDMSTSSTRAAHVAEAVGITPAEAATVGLKGWTEANSDAFSGLAFALFLTIDGVDEAFTLQFSPVDGDAQAASFSAQTGGKINVSWNDGADLFVFSSALKGAHVRLLLRDIVAGSGAVSALQVVGGGASSATGADLGAESEAFGANDMFIAAGAGDTFSFRLNGGSAVHTTILASNDVHEFVRSVNDNVGAPVMGVSIDGASATLTLTSYLYGIGSSVEPIESASAVQKLGFSDGTATTHSDAGLNGSYAVGTGRPNPDVWVRPDGEIVISGDILRNSITGAPLGTAIGSDVHVAYRALRTDLSPSASQPGILRISSIDTLQSVYGPISVRNPLALAVYFALLNAGEGIEINALGVDDASAAEPNGTVAAYASAAQFLRAYEIYSIVPLSQDENVIALFDTHVKDMSAPELRAERTVISAPRNPTRRNDEVVLSTGESGAESTGTLGQIDLNDSPEAILGAQGIDVSEQIPFELADGRQLYLALTIGDAFYRYSVQSVSGGRVSVRMVYSGAQNADGFYSTDMLPNEFVDATFSLALRGAPLTLPGSTLLDKTAYAVTVREKAQQYLNRRQIRLYPDTVQSSAVGGVNQRVESFYFASALAGAVATLEPQEPLTRVPMVGFNASIGPSLDRTQLNIISAGNAVIEPTAEGQDPSLRMQSTTDPSSIESREWSVTRAVDAFSKTMRSALRGRIGRFNITQAYLDDLSMVVDSLCTAAAEAGQFRSTKVLKLEQDPRQPDSISIEIQLEVLYPANYINVTLVV